MANNTVRTIVIFGLITLVLGGAAVGAVRLLKARNDSYATAQAQPVAANPPQQAQNDQKKEEPQKEQPQTNQSPQTTTPPSTSTPQTPTSTPAPAGTGGATPSGSMPATGPAEDFLATAALLSLITFFSVKLVKARADYRRYIGS